MKDTKIVLNLAIEGIHFWEGCNIEEVMFLKNEHRHIFYIEIHKEVSHLDRDIEIIKLKREIKNWFGPEPVQFGGKSCEMIADGLLEAFDCCYVKVLEDNENGAIVERKQIC